MANSSFQTAPVPSDGMPKGIPYIVGNEAAERFSFYGMRTILVIFMTEYLRSADGGFDFMSDSEATKWFHLFVMSAYFFPIAGAIISDAFLGKYRTILFLSVIYCLGHLALALDETRLGLFTGLTLIAVGTGAIKPCVSAHVGDQFGTRNQHLLNKVFGWFYFSINLGSAVSTLLTPVLLDRYGPAVAFGVPGILMFLATVVFWMGRTKFVHIPAGGIASVKEAFSGEGIQAMKNLALIYVFVAMFWSLFDQTGSAWVLQAKRMDLHFVIDWLPSQFQAVNPILVMVLIPLFSYAIYPAIDRVFPLTPLRKVSIGLFVTAAAFAVPAWVDSHITGGEVVAKKSEVDKNLWPTEKIMDGQVDGGGWLSYRREYYERNKRAMKPSEIKPEHDQFPQDIVIRLRERREWPLDKIRINPYTKLDEILAEQDAEELKENGGTAPATGLTEEEATARSRSCWAKDVEIFVGETRQGDPISGEESAWEWSRSLGRITLEQKDEFQTLELDGSPAEYLKIRIHSNWGGEFVSLGEVEVLAEGELPADVHEHAAAVWPNVAAIGYKPSIIWQVIAYILLTAAEVMVSITCLEFSYTQAPKKIKSFIMSLYLLSVSAGNAFTALVNGFIQNDDGSSKLEGANYYWFFTAAMFATALGFIGVAKTYRGKTYIQDESDRENTIAQADAEASAE